MKTYYHYLITPRQTLISRLKKHNKLPNELDALLKPILYSGELPYPYVTGSNEKSLIVKILFLIEIIIYDSYKEVFFDLEFTLDYFDSLWRIYQLEADEIDTEVSIECLTHIQPSTIIKNTGNDRVDLWFKTIQSDFENKEKQNFAKIKNNLQSIIIAMNRGSQTEAIALLKESIILSPADSQLHYLLGIAYTQLEQYEQAITQMIEAMALDPKSHDAAFQLGLLYFNKKQFDKANQIWESLINLPKNNPLHLFSLGLKYYTKNQLNQCITLLEDGIKKNLNNPQLNSDMQKILLNVRMPMGTTKSIESPPSLLS